MSLHPFQDNPLLAGDRKPRRWKRALPISIALHLGLLALVLLLPDRHGGLDDEQQPIDIVFYKPQAEPPPAPLPEPEPEPEPEPPPRPEPEPEPERIPEPPPREDLIAQAPPRPEPTPPPVVREDPPPAPPTPPPPERVARSQPEPPPVKRETRTGSFGSAKPAAEPKLERTVVATGGFGEQQSEAAESAPPRRVVAAGMFGGGSVEVPREPAPRDREVVTSSSFAAAPAAPEREPQRRAVVETASFDSSAAPAAGSASDGAARAIETGGFGAKENTRATAKSRQLPTASLDAPVEIVAKPKPVYTDEARSLRIEGEVVLEVVFTESGQLRVLRVLDGLGHGLDEAAVEAAKNIRFTPARREGRAVDHTATLRVVFKLA